MENKSLKPKIRFKGFTEAWEQRKFGDVGCVSMCKRIFKTQTTDIGEVPFFKIGTFGRTADSYITKKLFNEYKAKFSYPEKGDILISASGSIGRIVEFSGKDEYFQDSNIVWLKHNKEISNEFLKQLYQIVKWYGIEGTTIQRLYNSNILNTEFKMPSIDEQNKISSLLNCIDNLITLHQRKCDKLLNIKKSLLEKMFPKNGNNVPEIRFKGFTEAWEQRKLLDMCSIITKQTGFDYSARIKPSLVVEKNKDTYSFIQNKDFCGNNINFDTDFYIPIEVAKQYPKITLDTPSILVSISGKIGNVGFYNHKEVAFIGGAVGICKLLNEEDGAFSVYELESDYGQKYFQSLIKASSHANITVEDIRNIQLVLPKSDIEKKKIQNLFENIDNLITLHQKKLNKLKNIKKSLLEKMFV